jgi:hypothetical protein
MRGHRIPELKHYLTSWDGIFLHFMSELLPISPPYTRIGEEVTRGRITEYIPHIAIPKTSSSILSTYDITCCFIFSSISFNVFS